MQAQYRPVPYARLNSFHGPKRRLIGHNAGQAPPSWRSAVVAAAPGVGAGLVSKGKTVQEQGSRIFLSRLPVDVGEKDVEVCVSITVFSRGLWVFFILFFRSYLERRWDRLKNHFWCITPKAIRKGWRWLHFSVLATLLLLKQNTMERLWMDVSQTKASCGPFGFFIK